MSFSESAPHSPVVLSIAGTDPLRGAGIDADCWTALQHQCHACWIQTCVVDQDSTGVYAVEHLPVDGIRRRLTRTLRDVQPRVWKLGLAPSRAVIDLVRELLSESPPAWVVIDPVLRGGSSVSPGLTDPDVIPALMDLGRACVHAGVGAVITPNAPELAALTSAPDPRDPTQLTELANALSRMSGMSVLAKGGHLQVGRGHDVLVHQGDATLLEPGVMQASDVHGTGCHLAAAIAARLAHEGELTPELVQGARAWLCQLPVIKLGRGRVQFDHVAGGIR